MIPQDTIESIKTLTKIEDVIGDYIKLKKVGSGFQGLCPFHTEKTPSFHVKPSGEIYKCFGCGASGDAIKFIMEFKHLNYIEALKILAERYGVPFENGTNTKQYALPKWHNNTNLSDKAVQWFKSRGITQKTLIEYKITEGMEYMPQEEKETNTLQFNYFRDDTLVNVKYRDGKKNFKFIYNAELIFYNLNALKDAESIIITEGEIDCLSYIEAGLTYVISVPNGASISSNSKLEYLNNCWDYFDKVKTIYLATDNDKNGVGLRNELARRLGIDRCRIVDFKDCKDANEYLVKHGVLALPETIEKASLFPISGVVFISDLYSNIDRLYNDGLPEGKKTGIPELDSLISFHEGYHTTITGIPTHGKSPFVDMLILLLAIRYGWKIGVFSPENYPMELHVSLMAEKLIGKRFSGEPRMNMDELNAAKRFINDHIYFIRPEDERFTLDNILDVGKNLVLRYGICAMVIDPWSRVEHLIPAGMNETTYISSSLDKLSIFKQKYGVHNFLVAHPTKIKKGANGLFEVPNLYDIAGSRSFYEKSDVGITVYRDFKKNETVIYVQKVKFKHWGKVGFTVMKYNDISGRYYVDIPDDTNWLLPKPVKPDFAEQEKRFLVEPKSQAPQNDNEFEITF